MFRFPQEEVVRDTLATAKNTGHAESGGNLFTELFEHAHDSRELELPFIGHVHLPHFDPIHIAGITLDLSITKHVVFLWVAALIVFLLAITAARKNVKSMVPKGIGNLIEVFVVFIRDEIAIPNMGKDGVRYLPYLLTTFFF